MYDVRSRYKADSITTAGPAKLLTMLYDRLLLDLDRGEAALRLADRGAASRHLCHAQDIVAELMGSLDTREWEAGAQLMSVYAFLFDELVQANVRADADRVVACRGLVAPLAAAWHEAAATIARTSVPTPRPAPAAEQGVATSGLGLLGVG
ncbi:flagellar export chaperone FliS [Cellulomonas endophytica]|uniref:flagellar export chaperone FliS n=1 Tax=Cellulomonas endophytica TaxID=2494735 RepID=UPI001010F5C4|nr:flagellar export chaperone FliS [Cellulomonas endophytica]